MSSRDEILDNIKKHMPTSSTALPDINILHVTYKNKNKQFAKSLKSVGGDAFWLERQTIDEFIQKNYKDAKVITSTCKDVKCRTKYANKVRTPHALKDVDLAVIEAKFAVAENGAVWVKNENNKHRALYFLAKQLLIIVKKENIVDSMHEAYEQIEFSKSGYGTFISGPSKTADIEQALVIGAHGPTSASVLFV